MAGAKNANLEGFERIAAALRREGYVVLLCVAPEDPDTGSPPRIAGAVTFRGTPEAPVIPTTSGAARSGIGTTPRGDRKGRDATGEWQHLDR